MSQHLAAVDYVIWFLGLALEAGIVITMIEWGAATRAKTAFSYIAFSLTRDISLLLISQVFQLKTYCYAYWGLQLISYALLIVLGLQIAHTVIESARGLALYCLSMIGILVATQPFVFSGAGWRTLFLVNMSHIAAFMRCALFLLAAIHGIRWKWPYRGITAAFGIAAASDLAFNAIREQSLWFHWNTFSRTSPASSLIYLSIWLFTIVKPELMSSPDKALVTRLKEQFVVASPE